MDVIDNSDRVMIYNNRIISSEQNASFMKRRQKAQKILINISRYLSETTGLPFHYNRDKC